MAFIEEIVSLVVDGFGLRGWQDVSVDRSMESAEISFTLGASNPSWSAEAKRLRPSRLRTRPASRRPSPSPSS